MGFCEEGGRLLRRIGEERLKASSQLRQKTMPLGRVNKRILFPSQLALMLLVLIAVEGMVCEC